MPDVSSKKSKTVIDEEEGDENGSYSNSQSKQGKGSDEKKGKVAKAGIARRGLEEEEDDQEESDDGYYSQESEEEEEEEEEDSEA